MSIIDLIPGMQQHDCCNYTALWLALAQVLYTWALGYLSVRHRAKNVSTSTVQEKIADEYKGSSILVPKWGYPDQGSGRFAATLPYLNWYKWNTAMRVHQDAADYLVPELIATIGNWYFCTTAGWVVGTAILVTRILYTMVYMRDISTAQHLSKLHSLVVAGGLGLALYRSF